MIENKEYPTPLVSVILPVYNAQKYISETIESVLNQSQLSWELIIIDDGSTDESFKIISNYSDSRIIVIKQSNQGVSSARNRGLEISKGKYITFLDADDLLPISSLESRVSYLEKNKSVDILDGNIHLFDDSESHPISSYIPYYHGLLFPKLLQLDSRVFFNVCYMFRADKLIDLRFQKGLTHTEDILFYMKLSIQSNLVYGHIEDVIYYYRKGHDSAMKNLKGLEYGYKNLINYVDTIEVVSFLEKQIFKLKIKKIMFLSWIHEKQYRDALKSLINLSIK